MTDVRIHAPDVDLAALASALCTWYGKRELETTSTATPSGFAVTCRSRQRWKRVAAADLSLTVTMQREDAYLLIQLSRPREHIGRKLGAGGGYGLGAALGGYLPLVVVGAGIMARSELQQRRLRDETIKFLRKTAQPNAGG